MYIIGMSIKVSGIRYTYQIDFFNQVPTQVKSQVHHLPPAHAPQPTEIDRREDMRSHLLNTEDRFPYSGVRAAPAIADSPTQPAASPPTGERLADQPLTTTASPAPSSFDRTAANASPAAQTAFPAAAIAGNFPNRTAAPATGSPLAPTSLATPPLAETIPIGELPTAEAIPQLDAEPATEVKAIPKYEFIRAMRAYKPELASFLQPTGYETINDQRVTPEAGIPASQPAQLNTAVGQTPLQITDAEPIEPSATTNMGVANPSNDFNQPRKGENFMVTQAFKLYELISGNAFMTAGSAVDMQY